MSPRERERSTGTPPTGGRGGRPDAGARRRRVQDLEDPGRGLATCRALVVGRGESPQRHEELRRDDQHGERRGEPDAAAHEAQAQLHGHQGHRHRGAEFEHEAGLERGPQHRHRRVAIAEADLADPVRLLPAAPEGPERRDSLQHVGEVALHPAQVGGPGGGCRADPPADQPQQQDEHGSGRQQHHGGRRIDHEHDHEDHDRDDVGEQGRRPERSHPGLGGLEAVDERRGDLAAPFAGHIRRAESEQVAGQTSADAGHEVDRRAAGESLGQAEQVARTATSAASTTRRAPGHPPAACPARRRR